MFAIIESGSKQYMVQEGDIIDVELLNIDDTQVEFNTVLLLDDGEQIKIGGPYLQECTVKAEVVGMSKDKKVFAFKYKKRKSSARKVGHRQKKTKLKIININVS
jgi:large subunit ribosomal protein L21